MASAVAPSEMPTDLSWRSVVMRAALFLVLAFAVYLPALRAGFIWDDDFHVTKSLTIQTWEGLYRTWFDLGWTPQYYPLVHTSFWIEHKLWGFNPLGYHAVNILIHGLNAALVWLILRKLRVPGAWIAGAIFAVHPVHVESVAWISERKNTLSGLFYLGAVMAYLNFERMEEGTNASSRKDWKCYGLCLGLFLCALLSKTVTATLPVVLGLILYWRRGQWSVRELEPLVPMLLLGAGMGLFTALVEKGFVGAKGQDWALAPIERVLVAGRAIWFYATKLVWPTRLTFIYPRWEVDGMAAWQYVFPVAAIAVVAGLWGMRERIGRGPWVAALCFGATLFPALGFVDVYPFLFSFVADHFQYLASIAIIALAAAAMHRLAGSNPIARVAPLILLVALGFLTWRQCLVYRNGETLWRDVIAKNSKSWMALNNLGAELYGQRRAADAIPYYEEALRLRPVYWDGYLNLARAQLDLGQYEASVSSFGVFLEHNPGHAGAQAQIAIAMEKLEKYAEAEAHYRRALEIEPGRTRARNGLGRVLMSQNRFEDASAEFETAIKHDAAYAEAHENLAKAYARLGRNDDAARHAAEARRLGVRR